MFILRNVVFRETSCVSIIQSDFYCPVGFQFTEASNTDPLFLLWGRLWVDRRTKIIHCLGDPPGAFFRGPGPEKPVQSEQREKQKTQT